MAHSPNLRLVPAPAPSRVSDPDALEARREFRALRMALYPSQLAASIDLGIGRASVERYEAGVSSAPHRLIVKMRRLVRERGEGRAA